MRTHLLCRSRLAPVHSTILRFRVSASKITPVHVKRAVMSSGSEVRDGISEEKNEVVAEIPRPHPRAFTDESEASFLFSDPVPVSFDQKSLQDKKVSRQKKACGFSFLQHLALQERLGENITESTDLISSDEPNGNLSRNYSFRAAKAKLASRSKGVNEQTPPPISIALLVLGTRGDVQPFIGIGRRLQRDGHRVRLATHAIFRDFVESSGLEFFPLGGDIKVIMAHMCKGRLVPRRPKELVLDVPKQLRTIQEIVDSTWPACTAPDPDRADAPPFRADAIISNPVVYGHTAVAEALGVPLQMVFTMPWTPTRSFPHVLSRRSFKSQDSRRNYLSYNMVDAAMWISTAPIISKFRKKILAESIHSRYSSRPIEQCTTVPFCYLWSPSLVPTPADWGDHIDVADFIFCDGPNDYEPPADLSSFLEKGDPPVFVGFGSCIVKNPGKLTKQIYAALRIAGLRGMVYEGWAGLGMGRPPPAHVFLVKDCPHDWLFPKCAAVCHHGGAGTTATGLRAARPTVIIPLFGDQPFWGAMVARSGAGPEPIPIKKLTVKRLAKAFKACRDPKIVARASEISVSLLSRDGADLAVKAFYRHLPLSSRGVLSYLGIGSEQQQQVRAGKIITSEIPFSETSGKEGLGLMAMIDRPIEDVSVDYLEGAAILGSPTVLAFGMLDDRDPVPSDFKKCWVHL